MRVDARSGKEIATQLGITVAKASHNPNVHEADNRLFQQKDGELFT
jgi:hypothetical protein